MNLHHQIPFAVGLLMFGLLPIFAEPAYSASREKVIYSFDQEGRNPVASLVFDAQGNLYGTAPYGGLGSCGGARCGVVFRLHPQPGGGWGYRVLYAFKGTDDGGYPDGIAMDAAGNIFGVSSEDGVGGAARF